MTRSVYYVSDSTAMTAKGLGQSLLSQFQHVKFEEHLRPYVDTEQKILQLVKEIGERTDDGKNLPIIFVSMMDESLMQLLSCKLPFVIDILRPFVAQLEAMIAQKSSKEVGLAHKARDAETYKKRIQAIDFTLATDDGLKTSDYDQADIILLGVSRTGKTPTALYLSLNFGLKVANYPFTAEDLPEFKLRAEHSANHRKLVGLINSPERLASIRRERRSSGSYAQYLQVAMELEALGELFTREKIPFVDTTIRSVEEIAALIMSMVFRNQ